MLATQKYAPFLFLATVMAAISYVPSIRVILLGCGTFAGVTHLLNLEKMRKQWRRVPCFSVISSTSVFGKGLQEFMMWFGASPCRISVEELAQKYTASMHDIVTQSGLKWSINPFKNRERPGYRTLHVYATTEWTKFTVRYNCTDTVFEEHFVPVGIHMDDVRFPELIEQKLDEIYQNHYDSLTMVVFGGEFYRNKLLADRVQPNETLATVIKTDMVESYLGKTDKHKGKTFGDMSSVLSNPTRYGSKFVLVLKSLTLPNGTVRYISPVEWSAETRDMTAVIIDRSATVYHQNTGRVITWRLLPEVKYLDANPVTHHTWFWTIVQMLDNIQDTH